MKLLIICGLIITSAFVDAQDLGDPNCDTLLLVSSWSRDNVKIYDGCDGEYIRDLADPGVLDGPQSMFQEPNGNLIVVSESNHKLVQFDRDTLSSPTTVIDSGQFNNPITVVPKDDNTIYLGSYSSNEIAEVDTLTWQTNRTVLAANNGQIQGIDIGMAMGPDGQLYVPGYDSDNILKVNPNTGTTSQFIPSGAFNLDRPRSILFLADRMLVTAWGNQAILSFDFNGQLLDTVVSGFPGAAGMVMDGPDHILVTSDTLSTVRRYRLSDFSFETVVPARSGGLAGATFVYRLTKVPNEVAITGLRQAWLTGVGTINDNQLLVSEFITTGGQFGEAFDATDIEVVFWGEVLLEFTGCHTAMMSYSSVLKVNETSFGSGAYPVERLAMNPYGVQCDDIGFAQMTDSRYMSGVFYGGVERNGEGFTVDYLNRNQAVVTWFTYLPQE